MGKKIKLLVVFGTRPEAIKLAPVIKELYKIKNFHVLICSTSQHKEMLDQVLKLFKLIPDFSLEIMGKNQSISDITTKIIKKMQTILESEKPDIVLLHGDTTTTLAAGMSAYYHKIKIAHIEAGLRTGNLFSPWPEEGNRKIVGSITNYHYAPTKKAKDNLLNEGVSRNTIRITGNTVVDSILWTKNIIKNDIKIQKKLNNNFSFISKKFVLITCHRREKFGEGINSICIAIKKIALMHPNVIFIFSVHLNPNVKKPVYKYLSKIDNIKLIPPQDYLEFTYLMMNSYFILTDSGGIQEEAISLNIPVLVMRNKTERPEGVNAGGIALVGTSKTKIIYMCKKLLTDEYAYNSMKNLKNPYGNGKASVRIVRDLIKKLSG